MGLDRALVRAIRNLDEYELRRLVIYASDLLDSQAQVGSLPSDSQPEVRVRSQKIRCGKPNCTKCPHGPYWYAYWREDGKPRTRYLGKKLPEEYRR